MSNLIRETWLQYNKTYLSTCIESLKFYLRGFLYKGQKNEVTVNSPIIDRTLPLPAIERLSNDLRLSSFEKSVLILCAGMELDPEVPKLIATFDGDSNGPPSVGFVIKILPSSDKTAFAQSSPLRHYELIDLHCKSSLALEACHITVNKHILRYLVGSA
jgi:hypothetical protein